MIFRIGDLVTIKHDVVVPPDGTDKAIHGTIEVAYVVRGAQRIRPAPVRGWSQDSLQIKLVPTSPNSKTIFLEIEKINRMIDEGVLQHFPIKSLTPIEKIKRRTHAQSSAI